MIVVASKWFGWTLVSWILSYIDFVLFTLSWWNLCTDPSGC